MSDGEMSEVDHPSRHSGAMPTGPASGRPDDRLRIELRCAIAHRRISRLRVWSFGPSRHDDEGTVGVDGRAKPGHDTEKKPRTVRVVAIALATACIIGVALAIWIVSLGP